MNNMQVNSVVPSIKHHVVFWYKLPSCRDALNLPSFNNRIQHRHWFIRCQQHFNGRDWWRRLYINLWTIFITIFITTLTMFITMFHKFILEWLFDYLISKCFFWQCRESNLYAKRYASSIVNSKFVWRIFDLIMLNLSLCCFKARLWTIFDLTMLCVNHCCHCAVSKASNLVFVYSYYGAFVLSVLFVLV